jgi:glyoxylase-like metal-dependent hydrolase (beta-lactamase superfamily II)
VNRGYLLTGDTLFVSGVGRPDLGGRALEWGRDLYKTIHDRLRAVGDDVLVLPAHSSGPPEQRPDGTVAARLGGSPREESRCGWMRSFLREAEFAAGHALRNTPGFAGSISATPHWPMNSSNWNSARTNAP